MKKPKIFLSYAHDDQDNVKLVYTFLKKKGFAPWMDCFDIMPGENWERSIKIAIQDADFFLIFLSPNSVNRRGVLQKEIHAALDSWNSMLTSDIYLIPVRLINCTIPEELSTFQWVDIFEDSGWDKLLEAINIGMKRRKNDPRLRKTK